MNTINLLSDAKYFDESNTKLHELRAMLDGKSMKEKLEAMKSLLAMMTLGRDVSAFFPDVVKNVVVDSQEVKKLVYMFLIQYAEQHQDLALLSINTFQKDLASPSQRIRANAMKAMSSIRIPVAVPLVMLALKSACKDNSSYVKRAAACAIPKVASVDSDGEQHDQLVEMIAELLTSIEPIVLGSALFAFAAVCPERWDLLHPHFRKVCHLLADFDEWGQVVALNVLLRYGRTQFLSPFAHDKPEEEQRDEDDDVEDEEDDDTAEQHKAKDKKDKPAAVKAKKKTASFYSDEDEDTAESSELSDSAAESDHRPSKASSAHVLDEDHALLLRQSQSLLHSSNSAVILAIATLHWYLAPRAMTAVTIPPLIRLSRNKRSIQYILLTNVLTMCKARPALFAPYLRDFFVMTADAAYVKALKLDVLSYVVDSSSVTAVLKELEVYVHDADKAFVCQAVQCLARCSVRLSDVAERAMQILLRLVTSPHDAVVAQAVVAIRQLLQSRPELRWVVKRMARLLDKVRIAMARTAIVWMIGEYRDVIPTMAPDCLRKLAASFPDEDDVVKQQVLNLAVKLFLSNPRQCSLLFKYVMDMCKYDVNYDIRDRARLMRALFFKKKTTATAEASAAPAPAAPAVAAAGSEVKESLKQRLMVGKPAPDVVDRFSPHDRYLLGSMSQALGVAVAGYTELPDFPLIVPSGDVRKPPAEYVDEEEDRDRRRKGKGKGRAGSEEDDDDRGDSGSGEESDFSEFDSERSGSESGSRSGSDRSRSGSGSESDDRATRSDSNSDRDRRKRPAATKRTKDRGTSGGGRRRDDDDSASESGSDTERRGRSSGSESDRSDSRSASGSDDSDSAARNKKQREREKEKAREREREKQEREKRDKEKQDKQERERAEKDKDKQKKREDKKTSSKPATAVAAPSTDLLDLNELTNLPTPSTVVASQQPLMPSPGSPSSAAGSASSPAPSSPAATGMTGLIFPSKGQRGQLLNPINSRGLRIDFTFSRRPSLYGARMTDVDLSILNESTAPFQSFSLAEHDRALEHDSDLSDVAAIGELEVGGVRTCKVHIDWRGKIQPRVWRVVVGDADHTVSLTPDVGELVRASLLSAREWEARAKRLSGMSEHRLDITVRDVNVHSIAQAIVDHCNLAVLAQSDGDGEDAASVLRMSGQRLHDDSWVLMKLRVKSKDDRGRGGRVQVAVHCDDFLFATNLTDLAKKTLS